MSHRTDQIQRTAEAIMNSNGDHDSFSRVRVEALLKQLGFRDISRSIDKHATKGERKHSASDRVWKNTTYGDEVLITLPKKEKFSQDEVEVVRAVLAVLHQNGTLHQRLTTEDRSTADVAPAQDALYVR